MTATSNNKKKTIIIGIFCLLLVALAIGIAIVASRMHASNGSSKTNSRSDSIQDICNSTYYKETCVNSLTFSAGDISDLKELIIVGFQVAIDALEEARKNTIMLNGSTIDSRINQGLENCFQLMGYSIDDLQNVIGQTRTIDLHELGNDLDRKILLSGAITFEETCLDEFERTSDVREKMYKLLNTSRELTRNSLDMLTKTSTVLSSLNTKSSNRRLLFEESDSEFPSWVNQRRRTLLAETPLTINPDVIVAKDGSGKYLTIVEALKDVPLKNNDKTFVIYIKEGVYQEYVEVTKDMTNVMFIGDGPDKTKITGNKNFVDGIKTINTATVAILGDNFMAKNIGFENTAGAIKEQAVALRVQSHRSVFYNCIMDGYQDTLYAFAHSQFYRECTIAGTIDFIFGDAAVVFQNCKMIIKKPLEKQVCIVTAQGRDIPEEATGFVLQNCTITGEPEYKVLKDINKAYLGRPWKEYSRTIVMDSEIDDVIQPEGWLPWDRDFALKTLWYAEYNNRGPGSNQMQRVKWEGIRNLTAANVTDFTVAKFIGDDWIRSTGVASTY